MQPELAYAPTMLAAVMVELAEGRRQRAWLQARLRVQIGQFRVELAAVSARCPSVAASAEPGGGELRNKLTTQRFHLTGVPRTWPGMGPQGSRSGNGRLPHAWAGLTGGLPLTSQAGLVLMDTARAKRPSCPERC
jgi:hypothetical protein